MTGKYDSIISREDAAIPDDDLPKLQDAPELPERDDDEEEDDDEEKDEVDPEAEAGVGQVPG